MEKFKPKDASHLVQTEPESWVRSFNPTTSINRSPKIAAILPAYNEGSRIGQVLAVLLDVDQIDEIIVVDDGSQELNQCCSLRGCQPGQTHQGNPP